MNKGAYGLPIGRGTLFRGGSVQVESGSQSAGTGLTRVSFSTLDWDTLDAWRAAEADRLNLRAGGRYLCWAQVFETGVGSEAQQYRVVRITRYDGDSDAREEYVAEKTNWQETGGTATCSFGVTCARAGDYLVLEYLNSTTTRTISSAIFFAELLRGPVGRSSRQSAVSL